jgi:hypothetical protein
MVKQNYIEEKKVVSRLIYSVLTETLSVKEALLKFPKDANEPSIKASYHALVHFEADEDLRRRDILYKDEQNDYLEFIAEVFQKGEVLPENIIRSYNKYYKDATTPQSSGMKGLIKNLCKFLNV